MKTIQIFDDGFEALFTFKNEITDRQVKETYKEYLENQDDYFDTYEDFMQEKYPHFECDRFYIDSEIFI